MITSHEHSSLFVLIIISEGGKKVYNIVTSSQMSRRTQALPLMWTLHRTKKNIFFYLAEVEWTFLRAKSESEFLVFWSKQVSSRSHKGTIQCNQDFRDHIHNTSFSL